MTQYCLNCEDGTEMTHGRRDATFTYKGRTMTIPAVSGWHCPVCAEIQFDAGEGERYSAAIDAFTASINTQQAEFIRATRKRLHLSQKQAAATFGGGVNAFSEYERGITQPHKSTVLLLQLLNRHPELLTEIQAGGA